MPLPRLAGTHRAVERWSTPQRPQPSVPPVASDGGPREVEPLDRAEVNDYISALAAQLGIGAEQDFHGEALDDLTHTVSDAFDRARGLPPTQVQYPLTALLSPRDVETLLRTAVDIHNTDGDLSDLTTRQYEALATARDAWGTLTGFENDLDDADDVAGADAATSDDRTGEASESGEAGDADQECSHLRTVAAGENVSHQRECSACGAHLHLTAAEALRLAVRDDGAFYVTTVDGSTTLAGPYLDQIDADTAAEQIENEKHVITDILFECR